MLWKALTQQREARVGEGSENVQEIQALLKRTNTVLMGIFQAENPRTKVQCD